MRQPHIAGEERLRRLDGISEQYKLVYKGVVNYIVHSGKFLSAAISIGLGGLWIHDHIYAGLSNAEQPTEFLIPLEFDEMKWLTGLAILNCICLFYACNMSVLRIYRNGNKYDINSIFKL